MLKQITVDVPETHSVFGYTGLSPEIFADLVSRLIIAEARNEVARISVPKEVVPVVVFDKIRRKVIENGFVITLINDQEGGFYVLWLPAITINLG